MRVSEIAAHTCAFAALVCAVVMALTNNTDFGIVIAVIAVFYLLDDRLPPRT
jgi:hypothetical protein